MATPPARDVRDVSLEPSGHLDRYPADLRGREQQAIGRDPRVGVALSGGGIRSATFALGLFQGLAKLGLLRHVDIISTVSGGGYFGGFLGHLVQRDGERELREADARAAAESGAPGGAARRSPIRDRTRADRLLADRANQSVHFLRRNGRYLSPNGAGDLFAAAAVALRNWVSVLVVIGLVTLVLFTGLATVRYSTEAVLAGTCFRARWSWPWLSPWFLVAALALPVLAVPPGWSYWLVGDTPPHHGFMRGVSRWAVAAAGALAAILLALPFLREGRWPDCASWGLGDFILGAFLLASLLSVARYAVSYVLIGEQAAQGSMRRHLSRGLTRALVVIGILLLIAIFDSAGLALIHFVRTGLLATLGTTALVGVFRGPLLSLASRLQANEQPAVPVNLLVHLAAAAVLLLFFGTLAAIPHAVALGGAFPPALVPAMPPEGATDRLSMLLFVIAVVVVLSASLWPFVNRSSMHALYEARLRRAYLGASNPRRLDEGLERQPVTEPEQGDGLAWAEYAPHAHGGPLHLVNVTINETVDGRSQLQQRDRKGVGMAVGPEGVSVGVSHHALWTRAESAPSLRASVRATLDEFHAQLRHSMPRRAQQAVAVVESAVPRFRVFPGTAVPEQLDVGQWIAISGGAVSTGLGSRTNVALSILTGFFNVRLGYWWRSGVPVLKRSATTRRSNTQRLLSLVRGILPMQFALIDEWFARFPGTAREDWYLSDGGHFENLGAYELIRREMPLIIISDAEQDAAYAFDGLANLVRKARTDFDTEIRFLSDHELRHDKSPDGPFVPEGTTRIGTLEALRRGRRSKEPVIDPLTREERIVTDGAAERLSLAHAALARVEYRQPAVDGVRPPSKWGWLIYLKPTLDGDEPVDVRQYHVEHPAFPHESTGDQWFDEAQWESYRRLGEHIAEEVFGAAKLGQFVAAQSGPGPR